MAFVFPFVILFYFYLSSKLAKSYRFTQMWTNLSLSCSVFFSCGGVLWIVCKKAKVCKKGKAWLVLWYDANVWRLFSMCKCFKSEMKACLMCYSREMGITFWFVKGLPASTMRRKDEENKKGPAYLFWEPFSTLFFWLCYCVLIKITILNLFFVLSSMWR